MQFEDCDIDFEKSFHIYQGGDRKGSY